MDFSRIEKGLLIAIAILYPWHHIIRSPITVNLSLGDPLILITAILVITRIITHINYPKFSVWPLALIAVACVSVLVTSIIMPNELGSRPIREIIKLVASFAWLIVPLALLHRDTFNRIYQFCVVSCTVAITVSIWATYHAIILGTRRPAGPFPNPNLFADYLLLHLFLLAIVATLALRAGHSKQIVYFLAAGGVLFQVIALAGTQSRSAFAALLLAAVICTPWWRVVTETRIDGRTLASIGLVVGIGLVIVSLGEWGIINRYAQAFSGEATGNRTELWQRSLSAFLEHPIFGIGFGQHPIYVDTTGVPRTTHNTAIRFLVETGLIGFTVLTGFALAVLRSSVALSLVDGFEYTRYLVAYFVATGASSMFHDIINFRTFWIALALLCGLLLVYDRADAPLQKQ